MPRDTIKKTVAKTTINSNTDKVSSTKYYIRQVGQQRSQVVFVQVQKTKQNKITKHINTSDRQREAVSVQFSNYESTV